MKKWVYLISLAFVFIQQGSAQTTEINAKGLYLQGKLITRFQTVADIRRLLGAPDRITTGMFDVWTYDTRGLYFHVNKTDSTLRTVTYQFSMEPGGIIPAVAYQHPLLILGTKVSSASSLEMVKSNKAIHFTLHPVYLDPATTSSVQLFFTYDDAKKNIRQLSVDLTYKSLAVTAPKKYYNPSWKFTFSYPAKYSVTDLHKDELAVYDTSRSWMIACRVIKLVDIDLKAYVKKFAIKNLDAQETAKSVKMESRTISPFETVAVCAVPGFEMQRVSCFATDATGKEWALNITILKKINQPLFAGDGLMIYSFHGLFDMISTEEEVINLLEETLQFK